MTRNRYKIPLTIFVFVCVLATAFLAKLVIDKKRYGHAYASLAKGTPKAEVLKQFGSPTKTGPCSFKPSWDAQPLAQNGFACTEQLAYFSWVSPEQWVIGFDKDGRAITKYYLVSP
jgi:hypothetical protein